MKKETMTGMSPFARVDGATGNRIDDGEQKTYLIAIKFNSNPLLNTLDPETTDENIFVDGQFVLKRGRKEAFGFIKEAISSDEDMLIDIEASFVLVDGVPLDKRVTLFAFIERCKVIYDDNFDVRCYFDDESEEETGETAASGNGYTSVYLPGKEEI